MKMKYAIAASLLLFVGIAFAQQDDEDSLSKLNFVIVKDYNGKPIRNASVVLHPSGAASS